MSRNRSQKVIAVQVEPLESRVQLNGATAAPANMPPELFATYGGTGSTFQQESHNGQPVPGKYQFTGEIPVGEIMSLSAGDPAGGYHITTFTWSKGTNYSSYFSSAASDPAATKQVLGKNVSTNNSNYTFIVDSKTRSYTVTIDVKYSNGAKGESTVTFTSDKPTGNINVTRMGTQTYATELVALLPGIRIQATASTDEYTAGSFMFMQIATYAYSSYTDINNKFHYLQNNFDFTGNPLVPAGQNFKGPLTDDGSSVGYPFTYYHGAGTSGGGGLNYSWDLAAKSSMPGNKTGTPQMGDNPSYTINSTKQLSAQDNFSTYLMYKPTGGVWIALKEVDWSWSENATKSSTGSWTGTTSTQPSPKYKVPENDKAFPTWVNSTSNFRDELANPYRPLGNT